MAKGSPTGRKTKLNKKIIREAADLIKAGNYVNVVCQYLGIAQATWYNWLVKGEEAESGIYKEFLETIKSAEVTAEIRNVSLIQKAAKDDWKAAMTYLERRHPERWGRKDRTQTLEHVGLNGGPIQTENKQTVDLSKMSAQELIQLESILVKHTAADGDSEGAGEA